jgi:hypothetical protein
VSPTNLFRSRWCSGWSAPVASGFLINQSISLFRFDEMLTYTIMVLVLIVAVDVLSASIWHRLSR